MTLVVPRFGSLPVLPRVANGLSVSAELSVLQAMEPAGEPDEAWQRLYQRITQQRNTSGFPGGNSSEVRFLKIRPPTLYSQPWRWFC